MVSPTFFSAIMEIGRDPAGGAAVRGGLTNCQVTDSSVAPRSQCIGHVDVAQGRLAGVGHGDREHGISAGDDGL